MAKYICVHVLIFIRLVVPIYSTSSTEVDYFRLLLEFTFIVFESNSAYKIKIHFDCGPGGYDSMYS